MEISKLYWQSDFLSNEVYGDDVEKFVVGVYAMYTSPETIFHINMENGEVIEVFKNED